MSNLVTKAFLQEKVKAVDFFLETIVANDLKVRRSKHFLTLAQSRVHAKIQTRFSQKQLCRSEPFFYKNFQVQ